MLTLTFPLHLLTNYFDQYFHLSAKIHLEFFQNLIIKAIYLNLV